MGARRSRDGGAAGRGTIAATAAALGYTPSAVSQQLAALEREAGVILLDRTARSAELTDAGVRLAAHAERILAQVEEAEADLSAQEREPTGRVSVAAFPTAAAAFAPALARSLRAHPRLTLLLRQTQKDEGLSSVRWGEVEVALVQRLDRPSRQHRRGRAPVLPAGARPAGPRRAARPPARGSG